MVTPQLVVVVHSSIGACAPPLTCPPRTWSGTSNAWYGGSTKGSADTRIRYDRALIILPDDTDRAALAEDKRFFAPAYLTPSGWIGIDLAAGGATAPEDVDWQEVAELLDTSYRQVAGVRRVARLDGEGSPAGPSEPSG